jgi:carboxymethylenebutenolidase
MIDLDTRNDLITKPPSRRAVLTTSLVSALALATPKANAEIITSDERGLIANDVMIKASDGPLPGYFVRPEGRGPFPIILVNEGSLGVEENHKGFCRRLARLGYAAVTVEIYARFVDPSKLRDPATVMRNIIPRTPDAQMMTDLDAAIAFAGAHGGDLTRIGVTGFGRGGRNTWLYAAYNPRIRAAVAWYGPVEALPSPIQPYSAMDIAPRLNAPLLGLYAGQDPTIPVESIQQAVTLAKAAGRVAELVIYPDAPHGFQADDRPEYRPEAAADGWIRMVDWFKRHGV